MIHHSNTICDDCGERHTPGNSAECIEDLQKQIIRNKDEIAALKDENTALTVALTEQRRRMGAEYDNLDEKLKNVQSIAAREIQKYRTVMEKIKEEHDTYQRANWDYIIPLIEEALRGEEE